MKKILSILFLVSLLLSCNNEDPIVLEQPAYAIANGDMVTIRMSMKVGEMHTASRAFTDEKPTLGVNAPLWVVAFDGNKRYVESAKAFDMKQREGSDDIVDFSVKLHTTSNERILHFILNYADNMTFEYGQESVVIGSLKTQSKSTLCNEDVYWQRVVLPEGIQILVIEDAEGNLIPVDKKGDPVDTNNNGSIDEDEKVYTNTGDKLEAIPLVRNYAKITVVNKADNFTLNGYYVMNVPTSGTVAPYMGSGLFADYTQSSTDNGLLPSQLYLNLLDNGYTGCMPDGVDFTNTMKEKSYDNKDNWINPTTTVEGENSYDTPFYLYESISDGNKDHTISILLRGIYDDKNDNTEDKETFYKADLVYPDQSHGNLPMYYHVLRNFHYELSINQVSGKGKETAEEAASIAAGNNFSGSVDIKNLLNISNGEAALYVWYTDTLFVTSDQFELKYKFIEDITSPKVSSNDEVSWFLSGEDDKHIVEEPEPVKDENGNIYQDEDGWSILKLIPSGIQGVYSETLTLYNEETQLSREVVLAYRTKYNMEVVCPDKVAENVGEAVTVNIHIPTGLSETMFPLEFTMEAQSLNSPTALQNCLTPDTEETISVQLGSSIVPGFEGKKSYQYIVSLDYDTYDGLAYNTTKTQKILPVNFNTNIADNASIVYVNNIYFNQGSDFFLNDDSNTIVYAKLENSHLYGSNKEATLSFIATTTGSYTVSVQEGTNTIKTEELNITSAQVVSIPILTNTVSDKLTATIEVGETTKTLEGKTRAFPISNAALSASSTYYGTGIPVTLTFNMLQTGTANIKLTNLKDINGETEVAYTCKQAGVQSITLYSSDNASKQSAVISYENSTTTVLAEGTTRTKPVLNSATLDQTTSAYYGKDHNVDLTFNVSAPCMVTIKLNNGLTYNGKSEFSYDCKTSGNQTITLKSADWNTQEEAIVSLTVDVTTTKTASGATRNLLYIKANSVQYGYYYRNRWQGQDVGNSSITISGTISGSVTGTNLTNNGTTITVNGLTEDNLNSGTVSMECSRQGRNYSASGIKLSDLYNGTGNLSIRLEE